MCVFHCLCDGVCVALWVGGKRKRPTASETCIGLYQKYVRQIEIASGAYGKVPRYRWGQCGCSCIPS